MCYQIADRLFLSVKGWCQTKKAQIPCTFLQKCNTFCRIESLPFYNELSTETPGKHKFWESKKHQAYLLKTEVVTWQLWGIQSHLHTCEKTCTTLVATPWDCIFNDSLLDEDSNLSSFMTSTLGFDICMFVETIVVHEVKPEKNKMIMLVLLIDTV